MQNISRSKSFGKFCSPRDNQHNPPDSKILMWAMLNLVKKMVVVVVKTGTCFWLIGTFEQRKKWM